MTLAIHKLPKALFVEWGGQYEVVGHGDLTRLRAHSNTPPTLSVFGWTLTYHEGSHEWIGEVVGKYDWHKLTVLRSYARRGQYDGDGFEVRVSHGRVVGEGEGANKACDYYVQVRRLDLLEAIRDALDLAGGYLREVPYLLRQCSITDHLVVTARRIHKTSTSKPPKRAKGVKK